MLNTNGKKPTFRGRYIKSVKVDRDSVTLSKRSKMLFPFFKGYLIRTVIFRGETTCQFKGKRKEAENLYKSEVKKLDRPNSFLNRIEG